MSDFFYCMLTPIGYLHIVTTDLGLKKIEFSDKQLPNSPILSGLLELTITQLNAYFNGSLKRFELPLIYEGSDFQIQVWNELIKIPFGHTCTYKELAEKIGQPKAVRAVGLANNKNEIPIVIPCHRVIGSSGKLVGYAGDIWRKNWLLQHERKIEFGINTLF
jgi:methylated-DNA-[protein]-cysteine S-methyltransferase